MVDAAVVIMVVAAYLTSGMLTGYVDARVGGTTVPDETAHETPPESASTRLRV